MKKYTKGNKVIDLTLLPPCKTSLNLHLQRCNYIALIWKCSGWNLNFDIKWCKDIFTTEIKDLLIENFVEDDKFNDYEVGTDEESSDSNNEF